MLIVNESPSSGDLLWNNTVVFVRRVEAGTDMLGAHCLSAEVKNGDRRLYCFLWRLENIKLITLEGYDNAYSG